MKKLFFLAAAITVMASCADEKFLGEDPGTLSENATDGAIMFGTGFKAVTRADHVGADAASLLNNKFIVGGFKGDGSTMTQVFDNYTVEWAENTAGKTTSNTSDWEYVGKTPAATSKISGAQTIKYWDYSATQYDFAAFSTGDVATVNTSGTASAGTIVITPIKIKSPYAGPSYLIKGFADDLAKCYISDMVTAYNPADFQKEVQLTFRNLATKVRVALYETIPGYSVKDVKFYTDNTTTLATGATATSATLFAPNTGDADVFFAKANATVTFNTIGSGNVSETDYNKAHVTMEAIASGTTKTKPFGNLNYTGKEDREAAGDIYLARTASNPTFAGAEANHYYTTVLPNESGTVLELRVDYTLVSIDGSGEEIKIHGATAYVPLIYATWKSNYAYTYIFKISDNTNGWTSTVDTDPAGLFPITFDAIVVDAEENEQATITTVATPSITTYQPGYDYDAQDTYAPGKIYVQVMTGTTLETDLGSKGFLYSLSDNNATEAKVMDAISIQEAAIANPPATITGRNGLVLTEETTTAGLDAAIAAIPGVNGNDIDITAGTAAVFTAATGKTYAYVYDTDTYNGIYLAEEPADFASYYSDNTCTTPVGVWSAAGTFYKHTSEIRSYVVLSAAPSDWNTSANVYYSDEACTTPINSAYANPSYALTEEPADWDPADNIYYTDAACTAQANTAYTNGTYYKKLACYKKFTVNNKVYGVKVIKVQ